MKKKNNNSCCANCGTLEECYSMTQCPTCGYIGPKSTKIELDGYEDESLFLDIANYEQNNTKALFIQTLENDENDFWLEPFAEITTNIEGAEEHLDKDEILVKTWSENESLMLPLLQSGYFEDTGKRLRVSSWCEASIWKINKSICKQGA